MDASVKKYFGYIPEFAERRCSAEGRWEGRGKDAPPNMLGWTNYTPCYSPEVIQLFRKLYAGGSNDEADVSGDKCFYSFFLY